MNRTIATIACAIVYLASLTDSAVADPVRVRASKTADYGKIVFSWPAPVGHRLSVAGDTVVVRFNRPIEASYQRSLGVLSRYLANAEAEADDLGVRFTLRGDFEAYSYDAGNAVIVEFAQRQEAAAPQAAPANPKKVISRVSRSREVTVAQAVQAPADLPRIVNGNLNFPIIGNLKFPGFSVSVISRLMDQVWSFLGLPRRRLGLSGLGF